MSNEIAIIGQRISWTFEDSTELPSYFRGNTFESYVASVNKKEKTYFVNCEYGKDYIPFNEATIIN